MALDVVNIGTAPNDHTGDTLRAAMGKLNDNTVKLQGRRCVGDPNSLGIVGDYDLQACLDTTTDGIKHWNEVGAYWI